MFPCFGRRRRGHALSATASSYVATARLFLMGGLSSAAFEIFPTWEDFAATALPSASPSENLPQGIASLRLRGGVNGAGPAWVLLIASQIVRSTMTNLAAETDPASADFFLCGGADLIGRLKRELYLKGAKLQRLPTDIFLPAA
jgi:hypothetical protein